MTTTYFFKDFSKKQAKENVFLMTKKISRRLEEIKFIDIKATSRKKRNLILDEITSLKYLTIRVSKINHMLASKISIIYQRKYKNKKYITLNDTFSSSFGINSDYLIDIFMNFEFIVVNYYNI